MISEQPKHTNVHKFVSRGVMLGLLDAMCKAACQAAPWRQEEWRNLRHELEETLAAKWRKEDKKADHDN